MFNFFKTNKMVALVATAAALLSTPSFATDHSLSESMDKFLSHPTYCEALLEGRAGIRMGDKTDSNPDTEATDEFKRILAKASDKKDIIARSMVSLCSEKK